MTGAPDGWLTKFPKKQLLILGTALLSSLVLGFSASEAHGAEAPTADTTDPTPPAHPAHPEEGSTAEPTDLGIPPPPPDEADNWRKPNWDLTSPDGKHEGMVDNDKLDPRSPPGSGQTLAWEYKGHWVQDTPGGHWRWEFRKNPPVFILP